MRLEKTCYEVSGQSIYQTEVPGGMTGHFIYEQISNTFNDLVKARLNSTEIDHDVSDFISWNDFIAPGSPSVLDRTREDVVKLIADAKEFYKPFVEEQKE